MRMKKSVSMIILLCSLTSALMAAEADFDKWPGKKKEMQTFARYDFQVDGLECKVLVPHQIAEGRPWVWRARFFGWFMQADFALLEQGYHVAYVNVKNLYGSPAAMERFDRFYTYLTELHGFDKKAVLEGMSRGGLFVFNWAAKNPDKVHCIYADAPVCDIKSWPGADNAAMMKAYGFTTKEEALAWKGNPVDNLQPLADAGVPIIIVAGDADEVVPVSENTALVASRYKEMGGEIQVIYKPGGLHHPHCLDDPTPIVDFIQQHMGPQKPATP